MRRGGPDGTAEAVYEGVRGRGGPAGSEQWADAAIDCGGSGCWPVNTDRWIGRDRDRKPDPSAGSDPADLAGELKRLRRENEILRQERDILKRATAFFAREGSR